MAGARTAGVSGLAVAIASAGGLLLWTGVVNRPVREALQDLLQGRPPGTSGAPTGPALADVTTTLDQAAAAGRFTPGGAGPGAGVPDPGARPETGTPAGSGAIQTFVRTAEQQLGKPYRWATAGPDTFDCSGLVTYCLKAAGLDNTRRVTAQYLVWGGAFNVPRDTCRYGDLVCWSGHIGIATSRDAMIHAPSAGRPVQRGNIWSNPPPTIRRVRGA